MVYQPDSVAQCAGLVSFKVRVKVSLGLVRVSLGLVRVSFRVRVSVRVSVRGRVRLRVRVNGV